MIVGEIVLHTERICEVVELIDAKTVKIKTIFSATGKPVIKESTRIVRIDAIETRDSATKRLQARRDRCVELLSTLEAKSPFAPAFKKPEHGQLFSRIDFGLSSSWRVVTHPHGTPHHYLFYAKFPDVVAVEITLYETCAFWCFFLPFEPPGLLVDYGKVFATKTKSIEEALQEAKTDSVAQLNKYIKSGGIK